MVLVKDNTSVNKKLKIMVVNYTAYVQCNIKKLKCNQTKQKKNRQEKAELGECNGTPHLPVERYML